MSLKKILLTFNAFIAINNVTNITAKVLEINELDNFNQQVLPENMAIIKFYAPWCGPCKKMKSIVEEIEREYSNKLKVFEVNVSKANYIPEEYEISSVPQLLFMSNGIIKGKMIGLTTTHNIKLKIKECFNI